MLQGIGGGNWRTVFDSTIRQPDNMFQTNEFLHTDRILSFDPVYACTTLIANDIGKLRQCLQGMNADGVPEEMTSSAFSPVLASPNQYQNHIQFKQWWITSKLGHGNTYALKQRDQRNVVIALHILHPHRVTPLVAPDGSVYYRLSEDNLSGIEEATVTVPASEVIHDRMNCLFHPLIGTSPLYAAALSAMQGLGIQRDSTRFFANGSNPGGVLTAPGQISEATAKRASEFWEKNYAGSHNAGKVAVLGDGLKFEPMRMTSVDAQVADQLKLGATFICSAFHVPPFKIGIADIPVRQTVSDLNQIYYSDCLQVLMAEYELCMTQGIGADAAGYEVCLDEDGLLRMDEATQITTLGTAVDKTIMTPNEARGRLNLKKVTGGDSLYKQQQEFSLAALDARDRANPAPSSVAPAAPKPAAGKPDAANDPNAEDANQRQARIERGFAAYLGLELRQAETA